MNNTYKTVWSNAKQCFVVTSELAKSAGKKSSLVLKPMLVLALPLSCLFSTALVNGAPQNGVVTQGSASISSQGSTTTINQASSKAVINWSSFNIGSSEAVNFVQPSVSAVALNRISDSNGSQIMGSLNANGSVFLINPNGITFAKGAQVNVGALVASTLSISDESFLKGDYQFSAAANNTGQINNFGSINANTVALLGNQVINNGWIVATSSAAGAADIALVAADDVTIKFGQNQRLGIKINKGTLNALVDNQQLIQADGGKILLRAEAADTVLGAAVNNSGTIRAQTLQQVNGEILLLADMQHGTTTVSGTLDASAPTTGDGGFIETSAATVNIQSNSVITTLATLGDTGNWLIDPTDFIISATGGDISGSDLSLRLASSNITIQTSPSADSSIIAPDTDAGEPGDIYVNDDITWRSKHSLELIADKNIYINKEITASGDGAGVIFDTGLDNTASPADFKQSQHLQLGDEGKVTLLGKNALYRLDGQDFKVINGTSAFDELQNISLDLTGNYVLGDDIDASLKTFAPLGDNRNPFSGYFSGSGHEIQQLTILPFAENVGLFGNADNALIRDIGLTDISIHNDGRRGATGGIVGQLIDGAINNSYTTGVINGNANIGGIVGQQTSSSVNNSYFAATISGDVYVGGITGLQYGSSVNDSYSTGSTNGIFAVGGIVGAQSNSSVNDSYSEGITDGVPINRLPFESDPSSIGGIVGYQVESSVTNSYSLGNTIGISYVGGIAGQQIESSITSSYSEGKTQGQFAIGGVVGGQVSNSTIDDSHSTGITEGLYAIGGIAGVQIDSSIDSSYSTANTEGDAVVGGIAGVQINSSIDNSYSTANTTGEYVVGGIAGAQVSSSIDNSHSDANTNGEYVVGGIAGIQLSSSIDKSYSTGNTTGTGDLGNNEFLDSVTGVGGITGTQINSVISDSYSTGDTAGKENVGGIVGVSAAFDFSFIQSDDFISSFIPMLGLEMSSLDAVDTQGIDAIGELLDVIDFEELFDDIPAQSLVTKSFSSGKTTGDTNIGGIAGAQINSVIDNSYSTGDVEGTSFIGGIVGHSYSEPSEFIPEEPKQISVLAIDVDSEENEQETPHEEIDSRSLVVNTYAKGNISGANNVGGLIGSAINSRIETSYSSGKVTGTTSTSTTIGGFIGSNVSSEIKSSFFTESTGQGKGIGLDRGDSSMVDLTSLSTTASMELGSYTGFDISNTFNTGAVWRIYDGHITPVLTHFLTQVSSFGTQLTKIYSGEKVNTVAASNITFDDTVDPTQIAGTVLLQTSSANVGNYSGTNLTVNGDLYSTIYDINNASGGNADSAVTITPKTLSITSPTAIDKIFDGNTDATFSGGSLSGIIAGDTVNLQTTGAFLTSSVGDDKDVLAAFNIDNGNYQLAVQSDTLTASITDATTPIVTITPLDPNIPDQNNDISAAPEFDANPFGETAAGGDEAELGLLSFSQCKILLDSIEAKSAEEMTEKAFNCAIAAGQSNDHI